MVNSANTNFNEEMLKNYVRIEEYNKLLSELKRVKSIIACQSCKVFNESLLYCQTKCQHILCEICVKKACSELKKCLICSKEIEKGTIIKLAIGGKLK